jgi:hypothetical protein
MRREKKKVTATLQEKGERATHNSAGLGFIPKNFNYKNYKNEKRRDHG